MNYSGTRIMTGNHPFIVGLANQGTVYWIDAIISRRNADPPPRKVGSIALLPQRACDIDGVCTGERLMMAMPE